MAGNDFLCKLVNQVNTMSQVINNMQANAGLYTDPSTEATLTGRIKALEESTISSDPTESNISRLQVDTDRVVSGDTFEATLEPSSDCVNKQAELQNPDDPEIWESCKVISIIGKEVKLASSDYNGWLATITYSHAAKVTLEEFSFTDALEELVKNLYDYTGTVYKVIITITPIDDQVLLKWVDNNTSDFLEETIETEHVRHVDETEFNHSLYITGSADITIEVRNRLA